MPQELFDNQRMQALFDRVNNWGRWGADDERGALNYITAEKRQAAAALVKHGEVVSCALDFPVTPGLLNPTPAHHMMIVGGDDPCCAGGPGLETMLDYIGIAFHGLSSSHLDALCHVSVQGKLYNGFPVTDVKSTGARRNSVMACRDGIVGRGVLLDIAALRGQLWVQPEVMITPDELDAAENAQGVQVGEGDILLVHTGRERHGREYNAWDPAAVNLAGMHPDCALWFHERRIAVLAGDGVHDPYPQLLNLPDWSMPIHQCCLVGMGVHLLDNLSFEVLVDTCERLNSWEFQFVVAPLRVAGGTGSPVNPLALF